VSARELQAYLVYLSLVALNLFVVAAGVARPP
jgi:hypothetical protein